MNARISEQKIRVVKTVLSANRHFAGVTPAIFVIFVDFRGLRSKTPCFCGQNAISEFSPIFVKTTCFRQGTKRPFSKTTVSTTLKKRPQLGPRNFPAFFFCLFSPLSRGSEDHLRNPKAQEKGLFLGYPQNCFKLNPHPKDPSVLKIVRHANPYYFATAVVFQYPYRFPASFSS